MKTNEDDTNTAYDRMNHRKDLNKEIKDILTRAYADEKKHKKWIEDTLKN
jgi:hypothetical protein